MQVADLLESKYQVGFPYDLSSQYFNHLSRCTILHSQQHIYIDPNMYLSLTHNLLYDSEEVTENSNTY